MSIRKVSDLDSYLSGGTTYGYNLPKEQFVLSNFKESLFEISKLSTDPNDSKYSSRSINGDDLISAMYIGLSPFFANISALGPMSKKLIAVLNLFEYIDGPGDQIGYIRNINFTGDNTYLNVDTVINGTARRSLWS